MIKKNLGTLLLLITCMFVSKAQELKTENDSLSYAYGVTFADQIVNKGMKEKVNLDIVKKAIQDLMNDQAIMKAKDAQVLINNMETFHLKEAGIKFLADQKKRPEVKGLNQGILYEILKEGTGEATPDRGSDVTIHYEGRLITGEVFDSSYKRGEPATFNLGRLIKAWQITVPHMKKGEKRTIYVPYEVGYGARGAGNMIKPYSTLVFDIELIDF